MTKRHKHVLGSFAAGLLAVVLAFAAASCGGSSDSSSS
jgi:hypothetical protein